MQKKRHEKYSFLFPFKQSIDLKEYIKKYKKDEKKNNKLKNKANKKKIQK